MMFLVIFVTLSGIKKRCEILKYKSPEISLTDRKIHVKIYSDSSVIHLDYTFY